MEYVWGLLISAFIFVIFVFLPMLFSKATSLNPLVIKMLIAIVYLVGIVNFIISNLAIGFKRLRDLQWTLWLLPLFIIPFISMVMKLLGIFVPGKDGKLTPI